MKARLRTIILLAVVIAVVVVANLYVAKRRLSPPAVRSRAEIEAVLAKAPEVSEEKLGELNIVFVYDKKDHGPDEHDYPLWQKRWRLLLEGSGRTKSIAKGVNLYGPVEEGKEYGGAEKVNVSTAYLWPSAEQFKRADVVVMHAWGRWDEKKLADLEKYLKRGGGFVSIHPACIADETVSKKLAGLMGLAWEENYTGWRHGAMELKMKGLGHPICLGLPEAIEFIDEAYWPLVGDGSKINLLATSDERLAEEAEETWPEPMFWVYEYGKGRVFVCILGHYMWTFDDAYFRILVLRGMAWAAGERPYRFDKLVLDGARVE